MSEKRFKIAIIGDYNFTYNTHHATNLALDHSAYFLETEINYYWIKLSEASQLKAFQFEEYDGVWISPGPFKNPFYLTPVIEQLLKLKLPTFITGEGFKALIDVLVRFDNINLSNDKFISDNLIAGNQFEQIQIFPHSKALNKLYENRNPIELTSSRYSLYPHLISVLTKDFIDIEGYNQFEEPEIISLKNHLFFVSCGFCPQISSTREIPHPLIYTFLKACMN
jgi:CTP synthase (UTP-ammonia lyase)